MNEWVVQKTALLLETSGNHRRSIYEPPIESGEFEKKERVIMNFDNYNDDFAANEGLLLTDLDKYAGTVRGLVIDAYLKHHKKSESDTRAVRYVREVIETTDPEDLLSLNQCVDLLGRKTVATEDGHYITQLLFIEIMGDFQAAIFGTALAKAASDGYLECQWDDSRNDMVFWEKWVAQIWSPPHDYTVRRALLISSSNNYKLTTKF